MKPETMRLFLTPGAVWVKDNGEQYVVTERATVDGHTRFSRFGGVRDIHIQGLPHADRLTVDKTHPATLGIALDLARRAWKDPMASTYLSRDGGHPRCDLFVWSESVATASTEFDALIAAIEAASTEET